MLFKFKRGWEIRESDVTSESVYVNRRSFIRKAALGSLAVSGGLLAGCDEGENKASAAKTENTSQPSPSAGLYPAQRNERFQLDRELTSEELATTYNNFYEFGSSKNIWRKAQDLQIRPWNIVIDGLVDAPQELDFDDLLKKVTFEERLYRHRCVEAWSMAVPWTGFPMRDLVALAQPQSGAKYIRMETFNLPDVASGQKAFWYPWPYVEGLTIEEATNELAFIATGIYGREMPKQNGAPLRLVTPWKYGFKSIKSIVKFTFTDQRPISFWEEIQGSEYGFWANVNPEVSHPRWSQATEQPLGQTGRIPTQLYNGYGEYVADLYSNIKGERLFV